MAAQPWDNAAYANDTYLKSLQASSGDVTRQVKNALTEISRQRKVAGAQTAKIPGAANTSFDSAQGTLNQGLASLGVSPLASVLGAFSGGKASYGRAAGLFNQGFGEQASQRTAQAGNLEKQLLADITQQGAQYVSQREAEDRDRAFQTEENARARAVQERIAAMGRGGGGGYLPAPAFADPAQSFDEGFYRAVAAYGPEGGVNWLMDNDRPGGLTPGQRAYLDDQQRRQRMLSRRLQ